MIKFLFFEILWNRSLYKTFFKSLICPLKFKWLLNIFLEFGTCVTTEQYYYVIAILPQAKNDIIFLLKVYS